MKAANDGHRIGGQKAAKKKGNVSNGNGGENVWLAACWRISAISSAWRKSAMANNQRNISIGAESEENKRSKGETE